MMKYSVIDLFAGAGGLSLGFMQTNAFDVKVAVETNPCARETYICINNHRQYTACKHQGTAPDKIFMIGYIAGILTTIAFAPQLIKALKSKSTQDLSLMMLGCSTTGMTFWLLHGLIINDLALIIANSISVTLASALLFYKIKNDYLRAWRNTISRV